MKISVKPRLTNRQLTDYQRVAVAKLEYQTLLVGDRVQISDQFFGTVQEHITTTDGLQVFIIRNRLHREYTLLFKGSSGISNGTPETWNNEWFATNFPVGWSLFTHQITVPGQLRTAARYLNRLLKQEPNAQFYLYGHSLGAMNIQYALSHCHHIGQVKRADIYEGPNLFWLLNRRERHHVRKFKHKVHNYVDVYDPVTVGYVDGRHLVGKLHYLVSKRLPPIPQHMWGGYQFTSTGQLRERPLDQPFLQRAEVDQRWRASGRQLYQTHRQLTRRQREQLAVIKELLDKQRGMITTKLAWSQGLPKFGDSAWLKLLSK
ncbi:Mbeg1-like protein [Limosilactobacillus caecicola]|uniref:Mbeg1-like protein n=1 Tax=Limosilactobacillus caecicola TaxID=2941332 RepID=UPI002042149F|nr:Mbeg1-like protein [Limosilactobacillus caecicola]